MRSRPTALVGLLYLSTTVVWTSYSLLAVVLPYRFQSLGLSVVQYGVVMAIFAFGMLLTESVWGVLAFRIANPRTILGLGLAVVLLNVVIGLSTTFPELAIAFGLYGAAVVFQIPLFRWMALSVGGPGTAGTGTGRLVLFYGVGMTTGSALGPLLFVTQGFPMLIVVVVGTYLTGLALMVVLPWGAVRLPRSEPGSFRLMRRVLTTPFLLVAALVVLDFVAFTLIANFLQFYSVNPFHGTPTDAGYVIGAARATVLAAGFLLGRVVDRFGPATSVPFGFALITFGAVGTLFSSSYLEMFVWTLVFAAGSGWLSASLLPLALERVALPLQGTAVGVFGSFEDLGLLVGPVLISGVYADFGVRSIFFVSGVVALAGVALAVLFRSVYGTAPRRPTEG